ncbi:TIGR04551 family protein [Anaeromyxobacter oryzisoli]|uniref:TIGR04551 family protein n=1 Tax=Anaeromyxobacter oryzisoli TaxID=2925408 RepID=UPI001F59DB66|nr:TIGR04551 family protein [Anaeromyxobacter sp. SG63]
MYRLQAAVVAALLTPAVAFAQSTPSAPSPAPKATPAPAAPATAPSGDAEAELDPKTRAAIQRAVEKAKDDLRDEIRAEMQVAQSSAEFMGTVAEGPKLQFLELNGYFRVRGQLKNDFDLHAGTDASGFTLFPTPPGRTKGGTHADANMRLRVEPTLNISEHIRVRGQIDILDNYVLGSSTSQLFNSDHSPFPVPFYGSSRRLTQNDPTADRAAILPKRAWAEVQTPVGLLSFGRMPSSWGLGILANAGTGLDDDFGDTEDRIQFALPPLDTPIGKLSLVPILDFESEGVLDPDPHFGLGVGQPFDATQADDARTYAFKIARLDTDDEIRRKLDAGQSSVNFGLYYNYRTQGWVYPDWQKLGYSGTFTDSSSAVKRSSYAHVFDLWGRWLLGRWKVEAEAVGIYGNIGETFTFVQDPNDPTLLTRQSLGRVLLRQWGGALNTEFQALPNKLMVGGELGLASGDSAPGFGNVPDRLAGTATTADLALPAYGSAEGPQYGQPGDRSIRNFRFNPAYRVDLILWRGILGNVTDAWYLRPKVRWDILPGLILDGALIYSQAMYGSSTPNAVAASTTAPVAGQADGRYTLVKGGSKPLGIEADGRLTLNSGEGFSAWGEVGFFQPFDGLRMGTDGSALGRAWALNFGLAAKF